MTELKNKPLVEAILEIRWSANSKAADALTIVDDSYSLLLGRFFDRVRADYPFHEKLPTADIPDHMTPHVAKHRFRVQLGDWPLLQIGPGLLTLNDTVGYTWADFSRRANLAVENLFKAHPEPERLQVSQASLRYLDAIPLNLASSGLYEFLATNLKIKLELPPELFSKNNVAQTPEEFLSLHSFRTSAPPGLLSLRIGLGESNGVRAIILDTSVSSTSQEAPNTTTHFSSWVESAHAVLSEWFKVLTAGALYESFEPV